MKDDGAMMTYREIAIALSEMEGREKPYTHQYVHQLCNTACAKLQRALKREGLRMEDLRCDDD
jgi:hypothetical protein